MNELHLFAGAGGGILGGMLLGHSCVCAVEIEPYCRKVLLQRQRDGILPKFPIWDDVRTFDGRPWRGKIDVVCGGFPCQDISCAGKGAGIGGARSGLWSDLQESFAKYDRATSSWRTRQCLLFGGLEECLVTFPKAGTMRNGSLWERTTAEPRTDESACGYWRTPDAGAGGEISDEKAADYATGKPRKSGSAIQIRLCDQVRHRKLWPTPTRCGNYNRKGLSKNSGDGLATAVKTWPTPKCQDSRAALWDRDKSNLGEVVHGGIETLPTKTARLNPAWVEWLMGWPIGWSDLKPLETVRFLSWRQGLSSS